MSDAIGKAIDELGPLYRGSDGVAALHVAISLAWLMALFGICLGAGASSASALLVYPGGFVVAALLQHRLLILHHETLHRTLFRSRRLNEVVGTVAGGLIGFTMAYRAIHMAHHARLGQEGDPDLPNYVAYPASRARLLRDLLATLSGYAALRQFWLQLRERGHTGEPGRSALAFDPGLPAVAACQAWLFGICVLGGAPQVYLACWLLPLVTLAKTLTFLRNLAEHVATPERQGEKACGGRLRTIRCGPIEQLVFAPLNFNFHGEHHLYPGIPFHRLPEAHRILSARADYAHNVSVADGYLQVLFGEASH